jgi:hypothetical protein
MNAAPVDPPVQKWTWMFWLGAIAVVLVLHLVLILIFGTRKTPVAIAPSKNTPSLALAGEAAQGWLGLNDATLFALPDKDGFAGIMWVALPPLPIRRQDWTEDPRWLAATDSLTATELGARFNSFVQTNRFAGVHLEYNLEPPAVAPVTTVGPPFAQMSTLQIVGDIAKRPLLNPVKLPSWSFNDVIPPSLVQVLVDAAGNVVSATLLPPQNYDDTPPARDAEADQYAVQMAREALFAPLSATSAEVIPVSHLSVGQLIFNWQTVPQTNTRGNQ